MDIRNDILNEFEQLKDETYAQFQAKLIPTIDSKSIVGVRTPELRKMAKTYAKKAECVEFLNALPHTYFEENQLHSFIVSLDKDFDSCIKRVIEFLPYIDNWATCDQLSPKIFNKEKEQLLPYIDGWLQSEHTYTVRFGIGVLMAHFLDESFVEAYAQKVVEIKSEEYYVNMMRAWYFATALAKQYKYIVPIIEEKKLDDWTHNKTIKKATESYRIAEEQKVYLRTLKVPKSSAKSSVKNKNNG